MANAFNPTLLKFANEVAESLSKAGFVDAAMMGGAGGMPPGAPPGAGAPVDPMMGAAPPPGMPAGDPTAGAAPPMDPAMMGGAPPMDPAAMGAAPPMPPMPEAPLPGGDPAAAGGGGGGSLTEEGLRRVLTEVMGQGGGGAGGAGGAKKPKVDPGAEMHQIKLMLLTLFETMQLPIPPDALRSPEESGQAAGGGGGGGGESSGGGGGGEKKEKSAIQPIQPLQGASPQMAKGAMTGEAFPDPRSPARQMQDTAHAMLHQIRAGLGA